jgi:hypothetical protein
VMARKELAPAVGIQAGLGRHEHAAETRNCRNVKKTGLPGLPGLPSRKLLHFRHFHPVE